jgi:hypothetical protein
MGLNRGPSAFRETNREEEAKALGPAAIGEFSPVDVSFGGSAFQRSLNLSLARSVLHPDIAF